MTDEIKPMIRVGNTIPPQFLNTAGDWEIVRGSGGAYKSQTVQTVSGDYFEGNGNITKEFAEDMHGLSIFNDGDAILRFTVNGVTRPVFSKGSYNQMFKRSFRSVTITATGPWYIDVLQQLGAATSDTVPEPSDTAAPSNVTDIKASNVTETGLTLTWTAATDNIGVTGYDVYRGGSLVGSVTGTTYNAAGLTQGTQYTFAVRAKDAAGNMSTGTQITVTTAATPIDTTPPTNVTNVTTTNLTHNSLTVSWSVSSSSDVVGYEIYRGETLLNTVTGTLYNVTNLAPSTEYTFIVKAKDAAGNVATGTSVTVTTSAQPSDVTPPANVTNLTPSAITQIGATLTWTASISGDVKDYRVYNGSTLIATVTATTYGVTGLTAGTTYTFTVKSRDTSDNESAGVTVDVTTAEAADTTAPNPVTSLTAGTPTATTIPISWTLSVSGDVTTQEVAYSTDGVNFTVASAAVNASSTAYTVTGLTAGTAYTVRVVAIDGAGNRSTAVTVTASTATAGETPVISDEFNRADTNITAQSTTTLGTTPLGGKVWTNSSGFLAYGIKGNRAHLQWTGTGGTKHRSPVTVPISYQNYAVEVTFSVIDTTVSAFESLHFRFGADVIYLRNRDRASYEITKVPSGGSSTTIRTGNIIPTAGDRIRVECYEDGRIRWFVNGMLEYEIKETLGLGTSTKIGFASETSVSEFDDFQVFELSPLPTDTTPPAEVTNIGVSGIISTQMNISWYQPPDKDFKQVEIYNGETLVVEVPVPDTKTRNTTQNNLLTGLTPNTSYTFTIKTKDWSGNISSGSSFTRSTTSA